MTATLLIELGCEELPAGACRVADADAARGAWRGCWPSAGWPPSRVETHVSPRRIGVLAYDVPARQAAERVEHRGPPENVARNSEGWTKAGEGFARRHGLTAAGLDCATDSSGPASTRRRPPLAALAQELVDGLVEGLQMPKNMRWAAETLRFSRPIRTLAVLHGANVLRRRGSPAWPPAANCAGTVSSPRRSSCRRPTRT